jgi:hypothetical protein
MIKPTIIGVQQTIKHNKALCQLHDSYNKHTAVKMWVWTEESWRNTIGLCSCGKLMDHSNAFTLNQAAPVMGHMHPVEDGWWSDPWRTGLLAVVAANADLRAAYGRLRPLAKLSYGQEEMVAAEKLVGLFKVRCRATAKGNNGSKTSSAA